MTPYPVLMSCLPACHLGTALHRRQLWKPLQRPPPGLLVSPITESSPWSSALALLHTTTVVDCRNSCSNTPTPNQLEQLTACAALQHCVCKQFDHLLNLLQHCRSSTMAGRVLKAMPAACDHLISPLELHQVQGARFAV